jgi:branched-chain amino acid transport system ATP-binding protein
MTLLVRDRSISFGGVAAAAKMNLDVGDREMIGLIGPNGAERRPSITGVNRSHSGSAMWMGREVPALLDAVVTPEAVSSGTRAGLAWVPDL